MTVFFRGVIEGFYGRQWSWSVRRDYAVFLKNHGYNTYIYAPKGDAFLRSKWRESWPASEYRQLLELSAEYRRQGVEWGVGLSPLELFRDYNPEQKKLLLNKVAAINALNIDVLCILFDDMPGDFPLLAQCQLEIINDIVTASTAKKHIVCPTYYSFDSVLEDVFGPMPANYLQHLGSGLPAEIDIFWTGDHVISADFPGKSLARAEKLLGRKPVIWDNYLANDGRLTADFLRFNVVEGRSSNLPVQSAGHLLNPMNQAALSMLPLANIADDYRHLSTNGDTSLFDSSSLLNNQTLLTYLQRDEKLFCEQGLVQINTQQRLNLITEYARIEHPIAADVCDWLAGNYAFDPACLTG